ncbi:MAG: hypothetical protein IJN62_02325 [Clostridia bacterium]|nr:hypothetical protein [Clostridia bacterium]
MNCLCKATSANTLATGAFDSVPAVVDISVHGIGISVFKNKFFTFGL